MTSLQVHQVDSPLANRKLPRVRQVQRTHHLCPTTPADTKNLGLRYINRPIQEDAFTECYLLRQTSKLQEYISIRTEYYGVVEDP